MCPRMSKVSNHDINVSKTELITGNYAAAYAAKLARVQVVAAYPITPSTSIVEKIAELCATKEMDAIYIPVESEYSSISCCIGASIAGARTFTATSSQGLALMHELLHWASGARLPIVIANANRALAAPWSIGAEQTDSLAQRDTGLMQIYCENNQEVLDSVIQAFKIAETVYLPCMVCMDGFYLSFTAEPVHIPKEELVDAYLGPRKTDYRPNFSHPATYFSNPTPTSTLFYEFRYHQEQAMESALKVAKEADESYGNLFGRKYGLVDGYMIEDADLVLVTAGTTASTARVVIDELRNRGIKVGLLKLRLFRPFPSEEIVASLGGVPKVAVLERDISFGATGIFYQEIKAALYSYSGHRPSMFNFMAGLGGLDMTPEIISKIVDYTLSCDVPPEKAIWMEVN